MKKAQVSGWGRYPKGHTQWKVLQLGKFPEGVGIARGLGRSYGDAAFYTRGYTWSTEAHNQILDWQPTTGLLVAQGGVSLHAIIQRLVPAGWFPKVVPGTQWVTLGGAFASNIHGKNHHLEGSFAEQVAWIELRLPTGAALRLEPQEPLFWATAGGMGLTGIIETVALRLERIPSSWVLNTVYKVPTWEEALALLEAEEMRYPFAVAWLDHHHPKNRAILHLGRWAEKEELLPGQPPYLTHSTGSFSVPFVPPVGVFGGWGGRLITQAYWHKHRVGTHLVPYARYFFPLDGVRHWNRLWGPRGFVQFQFVVPSAAGFCRLWECLRAAPARSFLVVLKRLRAQPGPLGFGGPGWTLAIDLPHTPAVRNFLTRLTDQVLAEGGKIYLTKDALLRPEQFRAAYPEWSTFVQRKAQLDPEGRLRSDLSDRVGLTA